MPLSLNWWLGGAEPGGSVELNLAAGSAVTSNDKMALEQSAVARHEQTAIGVQENA
jgi:hypothetical protein